MNPARGSVRAGLALASLCALHLLLLRLLLQTVTSRLWNLDRLDQQELPLNTLFEYGTGERCCAHLPA